MIKNHQVTGIEPLKLPIFPGVKTEASVHVVGKDGSQKTGESSPDSVTPQTIKMDMNLPEQRTLHEISRQESVTKINSNFDTRTVDLGDEKVNHTTAKITLPNRVDDGDKLTLSIKTPKLDPNDSTGRTVLMDPADPSGKTPLYENTTRNFNIRVNDKGIITKVVEHTKSGDVDYTPLKEELNQWAINVEGFNVRHEGDTTINASITHINPNRNAPISPVEASASLEYVKAPEVIFDEAHGAKTMTREQAISDNKINNDLNNDLNSTMVTIKLPKNAVSGDKLTVTINEPNETPREIKYNIGKDDNGNLFVVKEGSTQKIETDGRSFKIYGIKTATGEETKVTAEIVDNDGSIQHAENSSSVMIAGLNDMAVRFVEDSDHNVSLTRAESKDGDNKLDETTIAVKVPNNVIAGDMVNVTINGASPKTYEVKGRDEHGKIILKDTSDDTLKTVNDKNEFEIKGVHIEAGKPINVTAETTDASGGKKAEAKNHNTLEKLHNDMNITFDEDADNDGILYNSEANSDQKVDKTTATIKLPSNFVLGDKLEVESYNEDTPNNKTIKTYEIEKDNDGKLIAKYGSEKLYITDDADGNKVVKYTLGLTEDHKTIINAKVTDDTGVDKVEAGNNITLNADGNGNGTKFYVLIDEDKDRNGKLSRDEANSDGNVKETSATVSLPSGNLHVGNEFTVKVNGVPTTYKVTGKNNDDLTIEDKDKPGHNVSLEPGNLLKIPNVAVSVGNPAKVEVELPNGVSKSAVAELERIGDNKLSVAFDEDNANRNNELSRDEAMSDKKLETTTVSVKVPYNVVTGDHVKVEYVDPNTGTPGSREFKITKTNGVITATDIINGGTPQDITESNTIKVDNIPMKPGEKTKVDATIITQDNQTASGSAEAELAQLSSKGLSVSIAADKNDDGVISRDESGNNKSTVKVSIPGSVIKGDKIDVEIINPDNSKVTKHYEVDDKNVNGDITLKEVVGSTTTYTQVSANHPLEFNDVGIAVDKDTVAKVTLTDAFNKSVSVEDRAHAEIDAIRGIRFTEDISRNGSLQDYENSKDQDTTPIKVYLNEDARAGDIVEIKYTDPDNHAQTKPANHILTADDIKEGAFKQVLDINPISKYDLKVDATYKTHDGLETKLPAETLSILPKAVTVEYNKNTTMKGGDSDNDTLVVDGQKVDFSNMAGLDAKVESFENIQLKGNSKITIKAQDVLDITDSDKVLNILNIKGSIDDQGNKTTSVKLDGNWEENTPAGVTDYKTYKSDDVIGHTIQIKIDDTVHIL